MAYLYKIVNTVTKREYIGITVNPKRRWTSHKYFSKVKNTPLYCSMRKHGLDKFEFQILCVCPSWEYACELEIAAIAEDDSLYNLAAGGKGGFVILDKEDWKRKLSKAREGGKPFLGGKHSEETKKKCGEASKEYWKHVVTYDYDKMLSLSFKEAHEKFGISKTHYYRLKRARTDDPS